MLGGALLPLLCVRHPPLHDYPGHLARAWIVAHLDRPALREFYEPASWLLPNIGMDAVMLALSRALAIDVAGRVFVALILALQLGGIAFLHRVWFGRSSAWPVLLGGVLLYNWILRLGFLGYLLGVGLVPWAFGSWLWVRRRGPPLRLAIGSALAGLLFFTHLVAFGLYALLVASCELRGVLRAGGRQALRDSLLAALPLAAVAALFPLSPMSAAAHGPWTYHPDWAWKPLILLRALQSGEPGLDAATGAALAAGAAIVLWRGRLELAPGAGSALGALGLAYLATPMPLLGSYFADARLPVALAFVAIAGTRARLDERRARVAVFALLAGLLVARSAVFTRAWVRYDAAIAEITRSFQVLPEGSVLFLANVYRPGEVPDLGSELLHPGPGYAYWRPPLKHVGSLATLERAVFVPATWANPAHFPLGVTSRYAPLYALQREGPFKLDDAGKLAGVVARIQALYARGGRGLAPAYLLVVSRHSLPDPPPRTRLVAQGLRFQLLELL